MHDTALLLAGYGTDPARLDPLAGSLRAAGVATTTFRYRPVGSLDVLAERLVAEIDRTAAEQVHLVGHSLGGIVAAAAALRRVPLVASVTTVNTPWRGTWVGYTGSDRIAVALRWRSAELRDLRADLVDHHGREEGPSWLLLSALGDLATPASTALRPGLRGPRLHRRVVASNGHSQSLASPRLLRAVHDHVRRTRTLQHVS